MTYKLLRAECFSLSIASFPLSLLRRNQLRTKGTARYVQYLRQRLYCHERQMARVDLPVEGRGDGACLRIL